jgi:hypothetical protein
MILGGRYHGADSDSGWADKRHASFRLAGRYDSDEQLWTSAKLSLLVELASRPNCRMTAMNS